MQDTANIIAAVVGAIAGAVASVFTTGVAYGIMKTKIDRVERDLENGRREYVSAEVFNATVDPIRTDLHEMQKDIKKILLFLTKAIVKDKPAIDD